MHRLTALCVRHPRLTLLAALVALAAGGYSALRTDLSVGMDANLGADHPVVRQFDGFLERFGGGYPVLIAYECGAARCTGALDPVALEMAHAVSSQLEQARFVARVASVATTPILVPSAELGLDARRLFTDGAPSEDPALRKLALEDPLWSRTLLSVDGRVGAIVVELAATDSEALISVIDQIRRALAPHERAGFRFHLVGEAAVWVAAHEDSARSMLRAGIGTGTMLFLVLLALLRSLPAVVATLATVGVTAGLTLGFVPLLGWQLSELTTGATTVILVIGCADCVHFVAHYLETRSRHPSHASALIATSRWVVAPCFLTTATSAGAFVSLAGGGLHSLVQFGSVAAIGVSLAFLLTFSVLPALLVLLPVQARSQRHAAAWHDALARLASFGARRSRLILFGALALGIVGAAGLPKLRVELSMAELWAPDHPVIRALDFVSAHLQRASRIELEITPPPETQIESPGVLRRLVEVERALAGVDGIEGTRSVARVLLHANRLLNGEGPARDSEAAVGELMTLVSSGDPGSLDAWITFDQSRLRISAEVEKLSTVELRRLLLEVGRLLEHALPEQWSFALTGPVVLATQIQEDFSNSQTAIVSASSLIVFVLLAVYLRSLPWALLAMIPNTVALLLLFGAMGHLGIRIDYGSAICAPIAIGIAADDTIHFLTAYARERRSGLDPIDALRAAISGVGEAVITTSAALALGFLSLATSPFASITSLGVLGAIAILGATLADLLVLPALIALVAASPTRAPALRPLQRSDVF